MTDRFRVLWSTSLGGNVPQKFKKLVQQVLFLEEVVLVTLQFDMTIQHPHPLLLRALKSYEGSLSPAQVTALGRCAWQILSDL